MPASIEILDATKSNESAPQVTSKIDDFPEDEIDNYVKNFAKQPTLLTPTERIGLPAGQTSRFREAYDY